MLARVYSCAVLGLEGVLVEVEVDFGTGLPHITMVGLPDTAVKESKERVRAAIKNIPTHFPRAPFIINLAPANVRKEGPAYDLPIAVGILITIGQLLPETVEDLVIVGELSLDGAVRHTPGLLPMADLARREGFSTICVPTEDAAEAALIPGLEVLPIETLGELKHHLTGEKLITPFEPENQEADLELRVQTDFREIKGQDHVKRALEAAAAGNHNMLMYNVRQPVSFWIEIGNFKP